MSLASNRGAICVLGGTGFVGRALAAKLAAARYEVRIPTRNRQRSREMLVLPGLELVQADVHDPEQLRELVRGARAVINLVGILNESGHDGSGFQHAHVALAEKLMAACRKTGVSRVLQMSALKANAERGASHYLRSKGQAEQIIAGQAGDSVNYTILRPSVIFGPEDSFTNRFAGIIRMSPVLPMPQLGAQFAPVYVADVAEAFSRALANSASFGKTYELCGPDVYTLEQILRFLSREMGLKRLLINMPPPLGRLQAWVGEYLLPGKPFSRDNYRSLSVASVCRDNGFAALGIVPQAFEPIVRSYLTRRMDNFSVFRQTSQR